MTMESSALTAIVSALICSFESAPTSFEPAPTISSGHQENSCLALDSQDPIDARGIHDMTADLITRIEGVGILSRDLKQYNIDVFNYPQMIIDFLDVENFIAVDKYTIRQDIISEAKSDPVKAVQSHYALMHELVIHVNKSRTDGQIKTMLRSDYPALNETLRSRLHHIQEKMYDVICSMKIALRGEGADTENTITQDVMSPKFLSLNKTLANETYRAYILMNDSEGIMSYLKEIYTNIQSSQIA